MALLDPVANAKTVGFIIIIFGVLQLLFVPAMLVDSATYDNPTTLIWTIVTSIALIVFGWGLRKLKKWALYGFIGYTVLVLLVNILQIVTTGAGAGNFIINLIIQGGLSWWFYTARSKFV